jgi:hypothetical protein
MRNTILAASAALAIALAASPGFAASSNNQTSAQTGTGGTSAQCADILADQDAHARSEVQYCQSQF